MNVYQALLSLPVNWSLLEKFYGVRLHDLLSFVERNANEVESLAKRYNILPVDATIMYFFGAMHGAMFGPFLKRVIETEGEPFVVGVGRDSVPMIVLLGEMRRMGRRVGIGFVGISSAAEKVHIELKKIFEGAQPDFRSPAMWRLAKILRRYWKVAQRHGYYPLIILDNGFRGTHVVPLKILARINGIPAKTAIYQVKEPYAHLHDHVGVIIPANRGSILSQFTEEIPHLTHPFQNINKTKQDLCCDSPKLWKVYEAGLRRMGREVLR